MRWLREDAIRPWLYRSWIFPTDPDFAAKAGPVLDLYEGRWEGKLLHPSDFVLLRESLRLGGDVRPGRLVPGLATG